MLEMSNGYPSSPIGPSPSPSPGLVGHPSSKCKQDYDFLANQRYNAIVISAHHLVNSKQQHSPSHRGTNLRVVIPSTPASSSNVSDELNYVEVSVFTFKI